MNEAGHRLELALLWCILALSALSGLAARLAMKMFHIDQVPPEDSKLLVHWRRRRVYMAISEIAALPAFATFWMAASLQWQLSIPLVVIGSMLSGALGFGFLIHALQTYVTRKVDNA